MHEVLVVTTPIYLLIAAGFAAVRFGWMQPPDLRVLGRFVAQVCVPALLFRGLSHQSIGQVLQWDYLAVYTGGSLATLGLVFFIARRWRGRPLATAALQALGAAGSNSAFVGYPIVLQVIGPAAALALALTTLVENLLVMPLALAVADAGDGRRQAGPMLRATAAGLLRNPMIVAIFAGLAVSASGWAMPAVLDRTVGLAAAAAPPTALFVIGGSLVGLSLSGMRGDLALVAGGKLLLHPLCMLGMVWLLPPDKPELRAAALLFAAMPMMSIYPVLAQKHDLQRFCAAALLAATVGGFFTITAVVGALPAAWLPAQVGR